MNKIDQADRDEDRILREAAERAKDPAWQKAMAESQEKFLEEIERHIAERGVPSPKIFPPHIV